ncbi:Exonuclease mut-7 [Seminavis robusta]|uniref:Exonuclease mut-7 n=1 Tax=Seminavis robusta TaxID=568900 RepID=A0A9N8E8L5_9STRA|nr:Exonuclease mut-7 [Seminavis robusta]|eukprot:Sro741_g195730.1 Exonuclease mut-7 (926) ;mRNA; r:25066-27843
MTEMVDADYNKGTPIVSSQLDFGGDDAQQNRQRRATFDRLQRIVESLTELEDNKVSLIWHSDREVNHSGVLPINSLLFQATGVDPDDPLTIVAIVPSSTKVNIPKLEAYLEQDNHDERIPNQRVSCSLVPAEQVEAECGFPPQSVPPLGHVPHTIRIIVDASLHHNPDTILLGGGGCPKIGLLVAAEILLKLEGTELASTTNLSSPPETSTTDDEEDETILQQPSTPPVRFPISPVVKPFFPLPPPTLEQVEDVLSNPDRPNPLQPIPFTFVGRINGIRRMARRLVFCDMAPPDYVGTGTKLDTLDLPWKSAIDQEDMAAQLIAGKTFCKNRGDGAEALRSLRVGQLILVEGKTNVGNRESLQHWKDKRSLDIVVFDYRVLEEAPPKEFLRRRGGSRSIQQQLPLLDQRQKANGQQSSAVPPNPEDCLQLLDVLTKINGDSPVQLVDSKESVMDFQQNLEHLSSIRTNGDNSPIMTGIDCEWKPNFMLTSPAEHQPVLLLQISLHDLQKVYLFDLQALLRPCLKPSETANELEQVTSDALTQLFGSSGFLKVGFQVSNDLQQLAGSYPHIPAFQTFHAVLEVGSVAKVALQLGKVAKARQHTNSLSRLTECLLGKPINKQEQISDWSIRPLTESQQCYAAMDAAVTPVLLEKSLALAEVSWLGKFQLGRHSGDSAFARTVSSVRFVFLENDNPAAVRKLNAKKIVSNQWIVSQSWVTGRDEPALPSAPETGNGPYVDLDGTYRVPAISLAVQNATVAHSLAGRLMGGSKDKCLAAMLSENNPAFPRGAKLEYHQRSGYVEFDDCVVLFVNSPLRPGDAPRRRGQRYPNQWLEQGKFLTWFLRYNEWQDGTSQLGQKLSGGKLATSVLFVRMDKGGFLCCGRCRVNQPLVEEGQENGGLAELKLELLDRDKLQSLGYFADMALSPC